MITIWQYLFDNLNGHQEDVVSGYKEFALLSEVITWAKDLIFGPKPIPIDIWSLLGLSYWLEPGIWVMSTLDHDIAEHFRLSNQILGQS